jgi:ribosomal-protein-alanine N-acetyltransferase
MKHIGTKELETERLILRKFNASDAEDMFNNWANDPEVTKYMTWCTHKNVEETKNIISKWIESYKTASSYIWGIVIKSTGELIGSISVTKIKEEKLLFEIGYCIGRKWWGNGYVLEALKEVIRYSFNEIGVNRIEAVHHIDNVNSGKVMLKAGMKYEGRLRDRGLDNMGNIISLDMYSILKKEYKEEK